MLVITGPNGNVGLALARSVIASGAIPYRIASRDPEANRERFGASAALTRFDFADRTTWGPTLEGARQVFLLFPLPHPRTARTQMVPFIEACAAAGVEHIVYVSVPGAERLRLVPHHAVESALRSSRVHHTILQASFFCQNLCRAITSHDVDIAVHDEIFIPAGRGRTSFLDARDVAAAAFEVLRDPAAHRDRTYVLTGPEALDYERVAEIFSDVLGRRIRYTDPSVLAFWRRLRRRGVSWDTMVFMQIVYWLTRSGKNAPLTDELPRLLGRPATTLRQFVQDHHEAWAPRASEAEAVRPVKTPGLGLRA